MNHAVAYEHDRLIDSFDKSEITGIRRRTAPAPIVVAVDDPARHPVPIHITVRQGDRALRYTLACASKQASSPHMTGKTRCDATP
jgi:hypothetical protein